MLDVIKKQQENWTQKKDSKLYKEADDFLQGGIELESNILLQGKSIREKTIKCYGQPLLNARLILASDIYYLLTLKSMEPGNTDSNINERLILSTSFFQGFPVVEELISEGQYIKASAVLKQDYEIVTRLITIRQGEQKYGKLANIKNAPKGTQKLYGELNDISHISKLDVLEWLISEHVEGEAKGVSPIPVFNKDIAQKLYEVHVWLLYEAVREQIVLFIDMYGNEIDGFEKSLKWFINAGKLLKDAGFVVQATD